MIDASSARQRKPRRGKSLAVVPSLSAQLGIGVLDKGKTRAAATAGDVGQAVQSVTDGTASSADGRVPASSLQLKKRDIPGYTTSARNSAKYARGRPIKAESRNKKLATHLSSIAHTQRAGAAAAYEHDALLRSDASGGLLQAETDLERTWKISQDEIVANVGQGTASKRFSLALDDSGPYRINYTADGRKLLIAGHQGHIATFDWQSGRLHAELQLRETVRAACWLHHEAFFAVAQKKYVYIYDHTGSEIHQMRNQIEVNNMSFLRSHFLLATVGNAGFLKYQDTSTGTLVAEHKTKLGSCKAMAQNTQSGVISLGHTNGTVTMWTPNLPVAQLAMLAHTSPISDIAVDPSSAGAYLATAAIDGSMKVWDCRKWGVVQEWRLKRPVESLSFSARGLLACGWGNHVNIYAAPATSSLTAPGQYMSQLFPSTAVRDIEFCPYEDLLGIGHARGISSIIIPGAGEGSYDSLELDPFESKKARREREVVSLLDKLQPDQITIDPDMIGRVKAASTGQPAHDLPIDLRGTAEKLRESHKAFRELPRIDRAAEAPSVTADLTDAIEHTSLQPSESKVKKPRGKNKVLKKVLRRRKTIIDEKTVRIKELLAQRNIANQRNRSSTQAVSNAGHALNRFT